MNKQTKIGNCSVWVIGNEMGPYGWVEGKTLEVGEGFKNASTARAWGRKALSRLRTDRVHAVRFKIGPAY